MPREGDQIGPYILIKLLGHGGCGEVWLSKRRTKIATTIVALKIPLNDTIDRGMFKREAEVWAQVPSHPNILSIIEADAFAWPSVGAIDVDEELTIKEQIVIASEYASDGSLASWLEQRGGKASSTEEALMVIDGVLAGLAHLHAQNIIHRDLKPENILFQGDIPRLSDFGISRILNTGSVYYGPSWGTLSYMPPEAFDEKFSIRSDLWAVGVILYKLLTGRLPFPQKDMTALIGAIVGCEPDPLPSSVPHRIRDIIAAALHKDRNQRPESATEMRQALHRLGNSSYVLTRERKSELIAKACSAIRVLAGDKACNPLLLEALIALLKRESRVDIGTVEWSRATKEDLRLYELIQMLERYGPAAAAYLDEEDFKDGELLVDLAEKHLQK